MAPLRDSDTRGVEESGVVLQPRCSNADIGLIERSTSEKNRAAICCHCLVRDYNKLEINSCN